MVGKGVYSRWGGEKMLVGFIGVDTLMHPTATNWPRKRH